MKQQQFTIQATAAAFKTLSTSLYSNPILAVIRELATNANDAHIEAGVSKPFKLHIPTPQEPFFLVRDYGYGLSEEEIFNIYSSFFFSTKQGDENQTGYFGLGSKSPFSVASEFTVISYNGGTKKKYLAKVVDYTPIISKISEEPSQETGLEVLINFNGNCRFYTWQETAVDFLSRATFMPDLNISDSIVWEKFLKDKEFYSNENISFEGSYYKELSVNLAGVSFPISAESIGKPFEDLINRNSWNIKKVNILASKKDISITPSREELHYDDKTKAFLEKAILDLCSRKFEEKWNNKHTIDDYMYFAYGQKANLDYVEKAREYLNSLILNLSDSDRKRNVYHVGDFSSFKGRKVFLLDFRTVAKNIAEGKEKVQSGVIEKIYSGEGIKEGKFSPSFIKKIYSAYDRDCIFILPRKIDSDLEELKTLFKDYNFTVIDYTSLAVEKKETQKRGFVTQKTNEYFWVTNRVHQAWCYGKKDLEENEFGIIVPEDDWSETKNKDVISLFYSLNPDKRNIKFFIKPCTQTVFERHKGEGYITLKDFGEKVAKDLKDIDSIRDTLFKRDFFNNLFYFSNFQQEYYDVINDKKFDVISNSSLLSFLRENYTRELFKEDYDSSVISAVDYRFDKEKQRSVFSCFNNIPYVRNALFEKSYMNLDENSLSELLELLTFFREQEQEVLTA